MNPYRLKYSQKSHIIGKDQSANKMLLGGLGALGVGQMWVNIEDKDRQNPEFKKALNIKYKELP